MTAREFRGTDRFRVLRPLGEGGMGVVYAAHDARRDEVVALKTLHFADPGAAWRLKQEFRTLAGVAHRNLIAFYELFADQGDWFFTMELVPGVTFLEFVRPDGNLDESRLRHTLPQLAAGIDAIHAAGKLHRDLKPSNVMVTPDERAVILDFGIATDQPGRGRDASDVEDGVSGTPAYMAPEQAEGAAVPASDWYALGCMLFEALTGRLPFEGLFFTVVSAKLTRPAPRVAAVRPDAPPDLADLCARLMAREPADRPTGDVVLRVLRGESRSIDGLAGTAGTERAGPGLVGRMGEMESLHAARRAAHGVAVTTLLHGLSGTGKSTLLDAYVAAAYQEGAVVLAGRCYVRETVPFKGLDGVLDSLSRWLLALPEPRRAAVASPALAAAGRLFPALGRIEWLAGGAAVTVQDPEQVRRDAVAALRSLLRVVAASGPLVLAVDDFQWGDRDGARLLEALMAAPDPPSLHLVVAFRSDEVAGNPFLEAWATRARAAGARDLVLDALDPAESVALAESLLGHGSADARTIAREAGGSPFLIEQLARYRLAAGSTMAEGGAVASMGHMLARRIAELPPGAAALLETLAVAARPLDVLVARDAAGLDDERPLTTSLLAAHLLRPSGTADHLELYHDKIREAIVAAIPPERLADTHRRLAQAMEAHGGADPVALYEHYLGVGDRARARRYAAAAADGAAEALAFEGAATLYTRAIELATGAGEETLPLEVKLADALAYAGRGLDAADAYLTAARQAASVEALELRRRAADQYLRCGHVGRGFAVVDEVLEAVGVRPTTSRGVALVRLLVRRAAVRLRGLKFREREAATLPPETIRRLDVCWTVSLGLVRLDNLRAADFQTYHLQLALAAGEPYRVARALACEAAFVSVVGSPSRARALRLVEATKVLAQRTGHPHAQGLAHLAEGIVRHFLGEFRTSVTACDHAAPILRERCRGVWWEVDSTTEYSMGSHYLMGAWDEMARRVPPALREAETHGDRYSAAYAGAGRGNVVWLVRDEPDEARRVYETFSAPWANEAYHVPHWWGLCAEAHVDVYQGEGLRAWERFQARWRTLRLSGLLRVQVVRIETRQLRGRSILAALDALPRSEHRRLLGVAARDAAAMLGEGAPWSEALGLLVRAAVAWQRGEPDAAAADLREGLRMAEATDLGAYAAAARRRLGGLLGGSEGADLVRQADDWFAGMGGRRPERLTAMLVPGFPD